MKVFQKTLLVLFLLAIILSTAASYYRFVVLHDYATTADTDCDPESEACFVWICDPEEDECTGDPEEDVWYYKVMKVDTREVLECDANESDCDPLACNPEETLCTEITCDSDTVEIYGYEDYCTNPATFSWPN